VPSWTVLNAYRQNLREGGDVLVVPDLWGGRGRWECRGRDAVELCVDVQNWGLERVGEGAVVRFWRGHPDRGGMQVAEERTTSVLLPEGGSETLCVEVPIGGEIVDYYARLDDPEEPVEGSVFECREDNNDVLFWRPSCR
jgi:hypothetical protein